MADEREAFSVQAERLVAQADPQTPADRLAAAQVMATLHLADAILVAGAPAVVETPKAKAGLGLPGGFR